MSPLTMLKRRLVRPVCPEHEKEGPAEAAGLPEADRRHRGSAPPLRRCRPPGTEGPCHPASSPERGTCGAVVAAVPGPREARRPTGSTRGPAPLRRRRSPHGTPVDPRPAGARERGTGCSAAAASSSASGGHPRARRPTAPSGEPQPPSSPPFPDPQGPRHPASRRERGAGRPVAATVPGLRGPRCSPVLVCERLCLRAGPSAVGGGAESAPPDARPSVRAGAEIGDRGRLRALRGESRANSSESLRHR